MPFHQLIPGRENDLNEHLRSRKFELIKDNYNGLNIFVEQVLTFGAFGDGTAHHVGTG